MPEMQTCSFHQRMSFSALPNKALVNVFKYCNIISAGQNQSPKFIVQVKKQCLSKNNQLIFVFNILVKRSGFLTLSF